VALLQARKPVKATTGCIKALPVADFNDASWGKDGHTSQQFPRNTRICIQYKGAAAEPCRPLT
jgi:hypothetical protein